MVPLSSAHLRDTMNSNSSEDTRLTNWPSVTATYPTQQEEAHILP